MSDEYELKYRHPHEFDIEFRWKWLLFSFKPYTVFEYTYDGKLPIATAFFTRKKAEQFVLLKKLEQ